MLRNGLRMLRNKIKALSNELKTLRSKSQKINKLRAFNKELHGKMINTMKKILIEFAHKRYKIGFFDKDRIILK